MLVDAGEAIAAAQLARLPLAQIVPGFAHHVRVYDVAAVSTYDTTDGTRLDYSRPVRDRVGCEIGGYHVAAIREDFWDPIVALLAALDSHHPEQFVSLMRALRSRSHSTREPDGFHTLLDNREQMMFELTDERVRRRQQRGFVSPQDARTFLLMSRAVKPGATGSNAITRDYRRTIALDPIVDHHEAEVSAEEVEAVALLADAGVVTIETPRALLESSDAVSTRLERDLRFVFDHDAVAYGDRKADLAYLANVLIAGCPIQSRPFTAREAADAAAAICNLGLEGISAPADYLVANDLVGVFQAGWAVLYEDVCVYATRSLIDILANVHLRDVDDQRALAMLRLRLLRELQAGTPWRAAEGLDVMMAVDAPAWLAVAGLIAECPVIHDGLAASLNGGAHSVDPAAFTFIAHPGQCSDVRRFMSVLPQIFRASG